MNGRNLLIVDDDAELGAMLSELLSGEGFRAAHVSGGAEALNWVSAQRADLAIIDVMMPGMDGFELLKRLRRAWELPVLMLTARGDGKDRILGLELGADDYLPKPFNPLELVARVRAILRRSAAPSVPRQALVAGPLVIDADNMTASLGGSPLRLTTAEFMVLEALARSRGRVQTRSNLSLHALGRPLTPFDRSIDTHVANIRRKLSLVDNGEINIRSFRGQGYILTVPRVG